MNRGPPSYTFQRRKRRARPRPPPAVETYTPVDIVDRLPDQLTQYSKYTFYIVLIMFLVSLVGCSYIFKKGMPVRIQG